MRLLHDVAKIHATFDDPNLVSRAGLVRIVKRKLWVLLGGRLPPTISPTSGTAAGRQANTHSAHLLLPQPPGTQPQETGHILTPPSRRGLLEPWCGEISHARF